MTKKNAYCEKILNNLLIVLIYSLLIFNRESYIKKYDFLNSAFLTLSSFVFRYHCAVDCSILYCTTLRYGIKAEFVIAV